MLRVFPQCSSLSSRMITLTVLLYGAWTAATVAHADGTTTTAMPAVASQPDAPRAIPRPRVTRGPIGELSEDDRAAAIAAMQAMDPATLHEFRRRLERATADERADLLRAIAR